MKRREIIKQLGVVPIAGSFLATESMFGNTFTESSPIGSGTLLGDKSIYEAIGVETIINCRGTFTILGGSTERPEVLAAIGAASGYFVQYDELAMGIGKRPVSYTHLTLPTNYS